MVKTRGSGITAKRTAVIVLFAWLNFPSAFAITETESLGVELCRDNPAECNLEAEGSYDAGVEAGMETCQDTPAKCNLETEGSYDMGYGYGYATGIYRGGYAAGVEAGRRLCLEPGNPCEVPGINGGINSTPNAGITFCQSLGNPCHLNGYYQNGYNLGVEAGKAFCRQPGNPCGVGLVPVSRYSVEKMCFFTQNIVIYDESTGIFVSINTTMFSMSRYLQEIFGATGETGGHRVFIIEKANRIQQALEDVSYYSDGSLFLKGISVQGDAFDARLGLLGTVDDVLKDQSLIDKINSQRESIFVEGMDLQCPGGTRN